MSGKDTWKIEPRDICLTITGERKFVKVREVEGNREPDFLIESEALQPTNFNQFR